MEATDHRSDALRRLGRAAPKSGELLLLKAATLDLDAASAAWRAWISTSDVDSAHHRSTGLLPAIAANLPGDVLGAEAGRAKGLRRRVWADNQFSFASLATAIDLLTDVGIAPIVAKGAALATTVYPDAGVRPMADVDVIVGADRMDAGCAALLGAGWRPVNEREADFDHAIVFTDEQGRQIDLHRWVAFPRFSPEPEQSWFDRAVPHTVNGRSVRRLAAPDELVLAVLHGMLSVSDSATRWPLDVVQLCRAGIADPDFWPAVVASATDTESGPVLADGLRMCRVEFGAPIPEGVVAELAAAPLNRLLGFQWRVLRWGVAPEWRIPRYRRIVRMEGRRPTMRGYAGSRWRALQARGVRSVVEGRIARSRSSLRIRTRN